MSRFKPSGLSPARPELGCVPVIQRLTRRVCRACCSVVLEKSHPKIRGDRKVHYGKPSNEN
jgi:hypothetical protein